MWHLAATLGNCCIDRLNRPVRGRLHKREQPRHEAKIGVGFPGSDNGELPTRVCRTKIEMSGFSKVQRARAAATIATPTTTLRKARLLRAGVPRRTATEASAEDGL